MTDLRTAAQQALELLQSAHVATALVWPRHDCVEALKAALEKPDGPCPTCVALARTVMMDQTGTA